VAQLFSLGIIVMSWHLIANFWGWFTIAVAVGGGLSFVVFPRWWCRKAAPDQMAHAIKIARFLGFGFTLLGVILLCIFLRTP
jgi:hypothetical protein